MTAQGAAAAVATARAKAAPPPALLSLPDETLAKVFAPLRARPGVALCRDALDAHALAAAHPRLDRLFRHELVTRLELTFAGPECTPASEVRRVLQRYPRATALALFAFETSLVDVAACVPPRLTVFEFDKGSQCAGGVCVLLARCRGLEELKVNFSTPPLDDEELGAVVSLAGPCLRALSLEDSMGKVTDAGGARLRSLTALTDLNLTGCGGVGAATLHAVAELPALASLCLIGRDFSEEHASAALPRMLALRKLDVSWCSAVGPWLWAALPVTLRVLRAEGTALLAGAPEGTCAAALAELDATFLLHTVHRAALAAPHTRALRVLSLNSSRLCDLDEASADAVLQAMPRLESLYLHNCRNIGDVIVAAVTRHDALRFVDMRETSIGPLGVRALRRWEEDDHPAAVRGEHVTADKSPYKRRALVAKRRALTGPYCPPRQ